MSLRYTIRKDDLNGSQTINIIFSDNHIETVTSANSNFKAIATRLLEVDEFTPEQEQELVELIKPIYSVQDYLTPLSSRVAISGTTVTFDGDPIDNSLTQHIVRIIEEGGKEREYGALVHFLEKLADNPSENSRNSLYGFILRHGITIDVDGDFYAYKGVHADGSSIHSGYGIVDGKVFRNANLPNEIGSVVEFPRSEVDSDTAVGCARGLHAGSYEYASSFSQGRLLTVKINPRDVVSVPDDCNYQKVRVCRYKVTGIAEVEVHSTTLGAWADDDDLSISGILNDEGEIIDFVSNAIQNAGELSDVSFTYENAAGEVYEIEGLTITDIKETLNGDGLLIGRNSEGETRSYRTNRISDFHAGTDWEDEDSEPVEIHTLADLIEALDNGYEVNGYAEFTYNGEDIIDFVPESVFGRDVLEGTVNDKFHRFRIPNISGFTWTSTDY